MNLTGKTVDSKYKLLRLVMDGTVSSIFEASYNNEIYSCILLKNKVTSNRIEDIVRFKSEVERFQAIESNYIIPIIEFGDYLGQIYIITEYFESTTLKNISADQAFLTIDQRVDIIRQVALALKDVHKEDLLHKDLRPASILIKEGEVRITDFCLYYLKVFYELLKEENILDAVGYISPEQSGVIKVPVDHRSDLYSLGVIMYQLFTGKHPFESDDLCSLMNEKIAGIPQHPSKVNSNISDNLSQIILKLMEKEPEARYQSTEGLIYDLDTYNRAGDAFIVGTGDKSEKLSFRSRFIGREKELSTLKDLFNDIEQSHGKAVLINGERGSGITRLLEEFQDYVYQEDSFILTSDIQNIENPLSHGPFRSILQSYVKRFNSYSDDRKKMIRDELKQDFSALGQVLVKFFPGMKSIFNQETELESLEFEGDYSRFHMVLCNFFLTLSEIEGSLIIVIDQFHQAAESTISIVNRLMESISQYPIMIICISHVDNTESIKEKLHVSIEDFHEISISNFLVDELYELFMQILYDEGDVVKSITDFIYNKTNGNSFLSIELLRHLIDENLLYFHEKHWALEDVENIDIDIPESIVDFIIRKSALLSSSSQNVMQHAAVIGMEFDAEILSEVTDLEINNILNAIDEAMALQIIESYDLNQFKVRFVHERVKAEFYKSLNGRSRIDLHEKIGRNLEIKYKKGDESIFDIAYHFFESGNKEKTISYFLEAGMMAKERFLNEEAIDYLEVALEILNVNDKKEEGLPYRKELGIIYVTIGRLDDALKILNNILPLIKDSFQQAVVYRYISDIYYRKGDWENCEFYARKGFKLLKEPFPLSQKGIILGIIWEIMIHFFHTIFSFLYIRKRNNPNAEKYRLIVDAYQTVNMSYALNNPFKFFRSILRTMNICERHLGLSKELIITQIDFQGMYMAIPLFARSRLNMNRIKWLLKQFDFPRGKALSSEMGGYFYEWIGDYNKSIEIFNLSYQLYNQIGDIKEMLMVYNGLEHCCYYLGNYEKALQINTKYTELAREIDDAYCISAGDIYFSQIYREIGEVEKAQHFTEKACSLSSKKGIHFNYCSSLIEKGANAIEIEDYEGAIEFLSEARDLHEKNTFLKQYIIPVYFTLADALLRFYASKEQDLSEKDRNELLQRIKRACNRAVNKSKNWVTHYGPSVRMMARYYALDGNIKKAEVHFKKSIEICKKYNRLYETGRTLYEYAIFKEHNGGNSKAIFEESYKIFRSIGSLHYIEKLRDILGIRGSAGENPFLGILEKERAENIARYIKNIRFNTETQVLLSSTISGIVDISGAQRGYLFLRSEKGDDLEIKAQKSHIENDDFVYSMKLVQEVYESEEAIVIENALDDERMKDDDELSQSLKSLLVIPILTNFTVLGVCYLDNHMTKGVFGESIANLVQDFISQISGTIESALLYDRLKTGRESDKITTLTEEKIKKALEYIEKNYIANISREGLAASLDINPDHLGKAFKSYTGKKISDYINELRIKEAADKLIHEDEKIIDIAFSVGYETLSTFNRAFLKIMKISPKKYRDQN